MTSINKKSDFMQQLNNSYQSGGLSCSFSDEELVQFINWKKKLYAKEENNVIGKTTMWQSMGAISKCLS